MTCSRCGKKVQGLPNYCPYCGERLEKMPHAGPGKARSFARSIALVGGAAVVGVSLTLFLTMGRGSTPQGRQVVKYIGYYKSITLTPEQKKIKEAALSSIPAPCCSDYSIATCCCPCNLAKSVWGLSHFLIGKRNYNVQHVKQAIIDWIRFANPGGYTGNACYTGRCNKPLEQNGCGGMDEGKII